MLKSKPVERPRVQVLAPRYVSQIEVAVDAYVSDAHGCPVTDLDIGGEHGSVVFHPGHSSLTARVAVDAKAYACVRDRIEERLDEIFYALPQSYEYHCTLRRPPMPRGVTPLESPWFSARRYWDAMCEALRSASEPEEYARPIGGTAGCEIRFCVDSTTPQGTYVLNALNNVCADYLTRFTCYVGVEMGRYKRCMAWRGCSLPDTPSRLPWWFWFKDPEDMLEQVTQVPPLEVDGQHYPGSASNLWPVYPDFEHRAIVLRYLPSMPVYAIAEAADGLLEFANALCAHAEVTHNLNDPTSLDSLLKNIDTCSMKLQGLLPLRAYREATWRASLYC